MSDNTICIAAMFRGPPNSGNGGYVAGVVASAFNDSAPGLPNQDAVEVTLRAPTPLDRPLTFHREGGISIRDGDVLIAEATRQALQIDVPEPATWSEADSVRELSYSFPVGINTLFEPPRRGVHPICFCCGAEPAPMEGVHVYSAPLQAKQQVAAAWIPAGWLADERNLVRPEFIWTALDCPGQMAWRAQGVQTGMLGRLTARIQKPVHAGERCVVIGWAMQNEGKKYFAGTALFNEANELCAYAKAVWIGRVA